jgi:hypothetical protein
MSTKPAFSGRSRTAILRRDISLYSNLAARVGLPPTPFMLPFLGTAAEDLADRRAPDPTSWRVFREEVTRVHPSLPVWTLTTARDGQVLASVVERLAYEALQPRLPASTTMILHPTITALRKWTADFGLIPSSREAMVHVEVAGLLASDWRPRNEREAGYAIHFEAKLAAYAQAGLPRPAIIHVDQVCDPNRLREAVNAVLVQAEGLVA